MYQFCNESPQQVSSCEQEGGRGGRSVFSCFSCCFSLCLQRQSGGQTAKAAAAHGRRTGHDCRLHRHPLVAPLGGGRLLHPPADHVVQRTHLGPVQRSQRTAATMVQNSVMARFLDMRGFFFFFFFFVPFLFSPLLFSLLPMEHTF